MEFKVKDLEVFIQHFAHFDILFGILTRNRQKISGRIWEKWT